MKPYHIKIPKHSAMEIIITVQPEHGLELPTIIKVFDVEGETHVVINDHEEGNRTDLVLGKPGHTQKC